MDNKTALIFGVTGQDGSYLSELLLKKNYRVVGVSRRASVNTKERIHQILKNPNFEYREGDVTDYVSVDGLIRQYKPNEIYNLAAMSHVFSSFEEPIYTWNVNANGVLNILESVRAINIPSRIYQASTSELMGKNKGRDGFQNEETKFMPQSPYAISKLCAHHLVRLYRETYNMHISAGILFNHESPRRGELFLTRKVTMYVAELEVFDKTEPLLLGNLNSYRDWGSAKDYVAAMFLMLQQNKPDDYVIATGETHSVEEFCDIAFSLINKNYKDYVQTDKRFFRPAEVDYLRGDASKAKKVLGWSPTISFNELVTEMVHNDIDLCMKRKLAGERK